MQIAIACRHGRISSDTEEYIIKKAEKLLNYFDRQTSIVVTIDFTGGMAEVELLVDADYRHDLLASETDSDVTTAFDVVVHKIEQRLGKPAASTACMRVDVDPGTADAATISDLFMAIAAVHEACGGSGLEIVKQGRRSRKAEGVSV